MKDIEYSYQELVRQANAEGLTVKKVSNGLLHDYAAMNPEAAKAMGMPLPSNEILIDSNQPLETQTRNLNHELIERRLMSRGMQYWPAHLLALKYEGQLPRENNVGKLSYHERQILPNSAFAIQEKRAYPIEDENHARDALARVSAFGTPEEKERVRAAVHVRYPNIEEKVTYQKGNVTIREVQDTPKKTKHSRFELPEHHHKDNDLGADVVQDGRRRHVRLS